MVSCDDASPARGSFVAVGRTNKTKENRSNRITQNTLVVVLTTDSVRNRSSRARFGLRFRRCPGGLLASPDRLVRCVLFVFEAVVLEQIGIREKSLNDAERNRLGKGFRVGNGNGEL